MRLLKQPLICQIVTFKTVSYQIKPLTFWMSLVLRKNLTLKFVDPEDINRRIADAETKKNEATQAEDFEKSRSFP